MKYQWIGLVLCFSFSIQLVGQSSYLGDYQKRWANATDYTVEMAKLMPAEEYDFRPTAEVNTFKEQLLHMMENMSWLSASYLEGGDFKRDFESTDYTKEEMLQMLKDCLEFAKQSVEKVKVADLNNSVEFFAGPMNIRQILNLMTDHLTHHHGQLILYLRLKGIKPPAYKGW